MTQPTRDRILACARDLAQVHGIAGVSFRAVADRIGIRAASVHHHFPAKDDLTLALVRLQRRETEEALAAIAGTGTARTRVEAFVGLFRQHLSAGNRFCLCGMLGAEVATLPDAARAELADFFDLCTAWLEAEVLGPPVAAGTAPADLARLTVAAVEGAMLLARVHGGMAAFDGAIAALLDLLPPR